MSYASGNAKVVRFVAETTPGTTPATPQTQELTFIVYNVTKDTSMLQDQSINATGQTMSLTAGNYTASATLEAHLAPDVLDDFFAAALKTSNTFPLKVGSSMKHFSIEDGYSDLAQYRTATGMTVDGFKVSVPNDGYATVTFDLKGFAVSGFTATPLDTTPTAAVTKTPFSMSGGTFKVGGTTKAWFKSVDLEFKNNTTSHHCLGSNAVRAITPGKVEVTATITGLVEDFALWNESIADTASSLEFTLVSGAESMTFKMGSIKQVTQVNGKGNEAADQTITATAFYNATDLSTLVISKV